MVDGSLDKRSVLVRIHSEGLETIGSSPSRSTHGRYSVTVARKIVALAELGSIPTISPVWVRSSLERALDCRSRLGEFDPRRTRGCKHRGLLCRYESFYVYCRSASTPLHGVGPNHAICPES